MNLYIYPTQVNVTHQQLIIFRNLLLGSLRNDATTWIQLNRQIDIGNNMMLPLFTHVKEQYQHEPFYFRFNDEALILKFENNQDENTKSMIIGMLVYYLRYNLIEHVRKIEVS